MGSVFCSLKRELVGLCEVQMQDKDQKNTMHYVLSDTAWIFYIMIDSKQTIYISKLEVTFLLTHIGIELLWL